VRARVRRKGGGAAAERGGGGRRSGKLPAGACKPLASSATVQQHHMRWTQGAGGTSDSHFEVLLVDNGGRWQAQGTEGR